MSDMLSVKGLSISFGGLKAVNNFAINIEKGQLYGLIGPNGAGKTTTFRILCGLLPATSGKVEVAGFDLRTARASARRTVGYVAQFFHHFQSHRVLFPEACSY